MCKAISNVEKNRNMAGKATEESLKAIKGMDLSIERAERQIDLLNKRFAALEKNALLTAARRMSSAI
jgi:hypothetical protein